jgi:UDP-glucose 4-epimerase
MSSSCFFVSFNFFLLTFNLCFMDNKSLEELIQEVKQRGGGMILNIQEKPEVVVLSIERYNQLLDGRMGLDNSDLQQNEGYLHSDFVPKLKKKVLVTGGAGYIGAHVVRQLLAENNEVVVLDNLSTGKREHVPTGVKFVEGNVGDVNLLRDLFAAEQFYAVVHMAASLEVEESVAKPILYLENNAINTEKLLMVMAEAGVKNIIFSSTAAVYGNQEENPISESAHLHPNNPYGYSKLLAERLIKYYCHFCGFKAIVFRYFNACGSNPEWEIGDTHHNAHLIPIVLDVVAGKLPQITVNGKDYNTFDGTCVRDYVHVLDIARAHAVALHAITAPDTFFELSGEAENGYRIYNIGTGKGFSVCEIINKTAEVLGHIIPMEVGPRRLGDAEATVADNRKIRQELNFELENSDLETIIKTSWDQLQKQ